MLDISHRVPYTGYRHSGRQIPSLLTKAGFSNIRVYIEDITSIGLTHKELDYLFHINFDYVKGDLNLAKMNGLQGFGEDFTWMEESFDKLNELFHTTGFFYNMGNVVITAEIE